MLGQVPSTTFQTQKQSKSHVRTSGADGYKTKGNEKVCPHKNLYTNARSRIIHNS